MSVECVLKLLGEMEQDDFALQNDASKSGNSNWTSPNFPYDGLSRKVIFAREYLLSDKGMGIEDRGQHFLDNYYDQLFETIDGELDSDRFVIVSLESNPDPKQWHNEIVWNKVRDGIYRTVTFYHEHLMPTIYCEQDLKGRIRLMEGTDIITYKLHRL